MRVRSSGAVRGNGRILLRSTHFSLALRMLSTIRPILAHRRIRRAACAIGVMLLLALAGCVTAPQAPTVVPPPPPKAPVPANAEPPPPNVNLSGFPLAYRQGYADGCASKSGGERKDAARFASDGNYRTGWTDGLALCKKR